MIDRKKTSFRNATLSPEVHVSARPVPVTHNCTERGYASSSSFYVQLKSRDCFQKNSAVNFCYLAFMFINIADEYEKSRGDSTIGVNIGVGRCVLPRLPCVKLHILIRPTA